MKVVAPARTFVMSRVVGTTEWVIERVVEKGEALDTDEMFRLGLRDPRPQEWAIAEQTARVEHRGGNVVIS